MKRVWITRAQPGAEATAERVREVGWEPLVAPLIETRPLPAAADLAGVVALAFTSATGVRAFAALSGERRRLVFAVGEATAAAASDAGFPTVISADGDVAALGRLIAQTEIEGVVLCPGAAKPAGDLIGDLERVGVTARAFAVYETLPADPPTGFLDNLATIDAVLIHSPAAGARLNAVLAGLETGHLAALAISPAALAPLAALALASRAAAALPRDDALISLLNDEHP